MVCANEAPLQSAAKSNQSQREDGPMRKTAVQGPSRRSLLRASLGAAGGFTLARPFIANAAAKSATVWWVQGFVPEEDTAFQALVAVGALFTAGCWLLIPVLKRVSLSPRKGTD